MIIWFRSGEHRSGNRPAEISTSGKSSDPKKIEALIASLKHEGSHVRREAAEALAKIGDPRAVDPLSACLKEEVWNVRAKAAEALGKIGHQPESEGGRVAYFIALQQWDKVVEIGEPAVDPLIACLKDKDRDVRERAAEALGKIGDKRAISALVSSMPDWDAKEKIAEALSSLGWVPQDERQKLYFLIGKKDKRALLANWEETKKILLDDLRSREKRKVKNAVYTFISLGREELIDELINILNTEGDVQMAETYLNSGHKRLDQAARDWAAARGLSVSVGPGAHKAGWGSW